MLILWAVWAASQPYGNFIKGKTFSRLCFFSWTEHHWRPEENQDVPGPKTQAGCMEVYSWGSVFISWLCVTKTASA